MGSIRWTALKLTLFTAVTIVVTTWLAMVIGNFSLLGGPYRITAEFTDATGVLQGDVVKAAGVTIGRVKGVEVSNGLAVVTIAIDDEVELPASVGATIRFRNLLGQRMITIDSNDAAGTTELLAEGDSIPVELTRPAFDLTELFNGLRPLIQSTNPADINLVSTALVEALKGREDEFAGFLDNVADLSTTVAARDEEIGELLRGVNVVASDLAGRDQQLRSTLSSLNSFLGDVAASRSDLQVAIQTLDQAATRFNRIIARNDTRIQGELADLATIFDAVNDKRRALKGALKALPEFVVATERATTYGQWAQAHIVDLCKDDTGTCGKRWVR